MFLSEWHEYPSAPCLAGNKKLDDSSRLDVVEVTRVPDMLPSFSFLVGLRTYQHSGNYPSSAGEGLRPAPNSAIFCTCASNRMSFNSGHCHFFPSPSIVDQSAPDISRWNKIDSKQRLLAARVRS